MLTPSHASPPVLSLTPTITTTINPADTEHIFTTAPKQPSSSTPTKNGSASTSHTALLHLVDDPNTTRSVTPESATHADTSAADHTSQAAAAPVQDDAYFNTQLVCCDQYLLSADVSFDNATKMIKTLHTLLQSVYTRLHIIYTSHIHCDTYYSICIYVLLL